MLQMDDSGSIEYSRNGKEILSEALIKDVFKAMGSECQTLALASVQLYWKSLEYDMDWADICKGVALIIKTTPEEDFFLLVVEPLVKELHLKEPVGSLLTYESRGPYFHCFERNKCTIGLNFEDRKESISFHRSVEHCLSVLGQRKPLFERHARHSVLQKQFRSKHSSPLPTPDDVDKQAPLKRNFRKGRKNSKLEIGLPQDFVHRVHVGPVRNGGNEMKCEALDLSDQATKETYLKIKSHLQENNIVLRDETEKLGAPPPPPGSQFSAATLALSHWNPLPKPGRSAANNKAHSEIPRSSPENNICNQETNFLEHEASQPQGVILRQRSNSSLLQATPISSPGCQALYDEVEFVSEDLTLPFSSDSERSGLKSNQSVITLGTNQNCNVVYDKPKPLSDRNVLLRSSTQVSTVKEAQLISVLSSTQDNDRAHEAPKLPDGTIFTSSISEVSPQRPPKPIRKSTYVTILSDPLFPEGVSMKLKQTPSSLPEIPKRPSQDWSNKQEQLVRPDSGENICKSDDDRIHDGVSKSGQVIPSKHFQNHMTKESAPMTAVIRELGNRLSIQSECRNTEATVPGQEHEYKNIRR